MVKHQRTGKQENHPGVGAEDKEYSRVNCGKTQCSENTAPELYKYIWKEKLGDSLGYVQFSNTALIVDSRLELWDSSLLSSVP